MHLFYIVFIASSFFQDFPELGDILIGTFTGIGICAYIVALYHSSGPQSRKILCNLLHERRLLFILILLIFLLRVDDYSMRSVIFFSAVWIVISFDFVATYIPRKMAFLTVTMILGVIIWNIINATFIGASCMKSKPWTGVYGEEISDCTIRRLINQTILSLLVSAAVAILTGATDILFFCNSNIYRATGTGIRMRMDASYVTRMQREKASSMRDALGSSACIGFFQGEKKGGAI